MVDSEIPLREQRVNAFYQLRLVAFPFGAKERLSVQFGGDCRFPWLRLAFDPRRRKPTFQIWRPARIFRLEIAERSIASEKWFPRGDARSIVSDASSISGARRSVLGDWRFISEDLRSQACADRSRFVDFRSIEIISKDEARGERWTTVPSSLILVPFSVPKFNLRSLSFCRP